MDARQINEDIYYISDNDSNLPFYVTIAGISYPDPAYHINRKKSQVMTVEYIIDGCGTIHLNGKDIHPHKGDVYILPQNYDHIYYSDSEKPWKKIWVNVAGPLVDAIISAYGLKHIHLIRESRTLSHFERIISVCSGTHSKSEVNDRVALMFHELISDLNKAVADTSPKYSDEVMKMKEYLDSHITENVSSEKLASLIYKSKSQAIRIFKSEMLTTPYNYLLERRFLQAKSLLQSTNLLVKEISYRCGFTDEHYFSDLFKRKCGTTPREYRNRIC